MAFIGRMYRGFRDMRDAIARLDVPLGEMENPSQLLATLLGRREMEAELSPYMTRPGMFNASLLDTLSELDAGDMERKATKMADLLTYVLGHVFANAVLRYPGPLLPEGPCCAYLAMSEGDADAVVEVFQDARFNGPFAEGEKLFWRDKIDLAVERLAMENGVSDLEFDSSGDYHRAVMESVLNRMGRGAKKHGCTRDGCAGSKGGFWCPFTKRAVCEREDCSSTASSWVPSGAYACRVEKVYFDERAPILGF